jgi:arylsulfatase A-like enzyme
MQKNVIVIMFDSLQFNYLGCYGNEWIKTPNMDRLAREGVLFENCYTEGLPTVPCRRAMHTGRFTLPSVGWSPLRAEDTTIADLCWGRPIDSALIFDCPMYRLPKFGYTRGFDKVYFTHGHEADDYFYENDPLIHLNPGDYIDEKSEAEFIKRFGRPQADSTRGEVTNYLRQRQYWTGKEDRYVAKTVRKAIQYLEQVDRNKQFYLWIDSFDPHEPWDPPSVYLNQPCPYDPDYKGKNIFLPLMGPVDGIYTEEQLHHIRMLYAELVTLCDEYLGILMEAIRRLGLEEDTMLMLVSDHGEPLGNGEHGHGLMRKVRPWPYEELAHTPLLLRGPGIKAGQRIPSFVQSCDVAPTVCDWLGIGVHPAMQGKSLLPLARGEAKKVRDFAIAGYNKYSWAIYTDDWSFIHWLGNDLKDDPGMPLGFYTESIDGSHLKAVGGKTFGGDVAEAMKTELGSEVEARHKATLTTDGAEQWTCTPGSAVEVPEEDELYDRRKDPFQLNNVIKQNPKVAEDMLRKMKLFITDLQAS